MVQQSSSVFDSLAKPVRKALAELGFLEPTLPQTLAFPHILAGKNVLLIAPTGTGKTEAVLLPIFSSLIQRVGRSGHSLKRLSEGIIVTVFPDDTLESIAAVKNAVAGRIEHVLIHENALDVLAHQVAGIFMDKQR
jgi:Lhr-like helicase